MESNALTQVLEVFSGVTDWLGDSFSAVTSMFYAEGNLTFLGVMALGGIGISVALLLVNLVKSFIRFR